MATNADETGADDTENLSDEEELRRAKAELGDVDNPKGSDETAENAEDDEDDSDDEGEDDGQTDDDAKDEDSEEESNDDSDEDDSDFVKEFPNIKGDTLEDYTRGLEAAYSNSTSEAMRLKTELDELKAKDTAVGSTGDEDDSAAGDAKPETPSDPTSLYMKQKMDEEITVAYDEFSKHYPQVNDQTLFNKFTGTVKQLGQTIYASEKRLASPRELYSKAAVILNWEPTETKPSKKEKVGMAIKGRAAVSKSSAGPKKPGKASKVSQAMIEANRKMYPNKSDSEIREELEPYIQ